MSNYCGKLHELMNKRTRYDFNFKDKPFPKNGIYILFEKNENSHSLDRIVRIGTHTGQNQLLSRIKQHFLNKNKDRSIFRKNIGRAILNKESDKFLSFWEIDLTSRKAKNFYKDKIDLVYQCFIEDRVSNYIKNNFSFCCFEVDDKEDRLMFESRIISTISQCHECKGSDVWLGNFSTKEKIRNSGLWLVNELYKQQLSEKEYKKLLLLL